MWLSTILAFSLLSTFTTAFSTGAPNSACESMLPGHGPLPQTSPITDFYTIDLSKNIVTVGESINITIIGEHKGAFLQVRPTDGSFYLTGEFSDASDNYETLNCDGKAKSTITHKSPVLKSGTSINWLATEPGEFELYATIVQSYDVFWAKQRIAPIIVFEN